MGKKQHSSRLPDKDKASEWLNGFDAGYEAGRESSGGLAGLLTGLIFGALIGVMGTLIVVALS